MYTQWNAINTHSIRRTLPERRKKKRENWWKTTKYDRFAFTVAATAAAADFAAVRIPPKLPLWSPNRTSNAHGVKMFYGAHKLDLWYCGMYETKWIVFYHFDCVKMVSKLKMLFRFWFHYVLFRCDSFRSVSLHISRIVIISLFLLFFWMVYPSSEMILISVFASEMRSTIWTRREEVSDHGTMTYAR